MKRTAICVGINYVGTSAQLAGCVNDAYDWAAVLGARDYDTAVILDAQATKTVIVETLRSAVAALRYRDRLVFTFSGHGTWVPDRNGDEIDRRDEALCPVDYNSGLITDDELHSIFSTAPRGSQITVLSDSCHSGTVARGLMDNADAEPAGRAKFLSPGLIDVVPVTVEQAAKAEERIVKATSRPGAVLISGCDDPEYSYDASFGGRPNGAFTRVAIDALPGATSMADWHRRIRLVLPSDDYPQSPQLGATRYQRSRAPLT